MAENGTRPRKRPSRVSASAASVPSTVATAAEPAAMPNEAAADLGCPPWKVFWRVTVPLSLPGLAAGTLLCFIPIVGEFVIPDLLGGSDSLMIGQTLWTEFFANKDWPVASSIAVVLLFLLVGPILVYQHLQMKHVEGA